MSTEQLTLEVPGWPTLVVDPTPAMARGDQTIAQCAWCGTVVIRSSSTKGTPLGACPACGKDRTDPAAGWWPQDLPLAGVSEAGGDR